MKKLSSFRLRKCSDIHFDLPFFEILDEAEEIIMDITESDDGERNILFHLGCVGKNVSIEVFDQMIKEVSKLLNDEKG